MPGPTAASAARASAAFAMESFRIPSRRRACVARLVTDLPTRVTRPLASPARPFASSSLYSTFLRAVRWRRAVSQGVSLVDCSAQPQPLLSLTE